MRSSLGAARVEVQDKRLDLDRSNAGPAQVNSFDLRLIRDAIDDCDVQLKEVALCLGVDQGYLTRMLSGEKPFPLTKLGHLPENVRRRYYQLGAGMPDPAQIGRWFICIGEALSLPTKANRMAKAKL